MTFLRITNILAPSLCAASAFAEESLPTRVGHKVEHVAHVVAHEVERAPGLPCTA